MLTGCGKIPNLQTFDLLVIPTQAGSTVLVAMGNEGLLVHPTGDGWQTVGVYTNPNDTWGIRIVPTPFAVRSLDEAINITAAELLLALTAGLLAWSIISIWIREKILKQTEAPTGKNLNRYILPAKIAFFWTLLIPAALLYLTARNAILLFTIFALPFWLILAGLIFWHFRLTSNIPGPMWKVELYVFLCGASIVLMAWLPFGLWAYGLIGSHALSLALAFICGFAALVGSLLWLRLRIIAYQCI